MKDLNKTELNERLRLLEQAKRDTWKVVSKYTAKTVLKAQHLSTRDILKSCGIGLID